MTKILAIHVIRANQQSGSCAVESPQSRDGCYTENCIVFATTGHARSEHARVLNNITRVIPGITVCRYELPTDTIEIENYDDHNTRTY